MEEKVHNCLIIGSGPAGYTAAIYAARANMEPVLYQGEEPGGQLMITNDVENYPGYPEGVQGPQMMVDFQKQAERFDTDVRHGHITAIDLSKQPFEAVANGTDTIRAHTIVISTGASAKWLGLEGETTYNGKGVSACAVCDGFFFRGQEVALVGGGDTAAEEATYLSKICKKVTMLVRRDEMRASKIMQERVMDASNIEILWHHETKDIYGDEEGVQGIIAVNNQTGEEIDLKVTGFFVAIGHKPNTDIFRGQLDMDEVGYILTQGRSTHTNVPGVFASGDAQDAHYRQAVTAAGTGCMAALDAERYLVEKGII